jgi:hypothetical protein
MRDRQKLVIDDRTVRVSRNLREALNQLWAMGQKLVWADYLCINSGGR